MAEARQEGQAGVTVFIQVDGGGEAGGGPGSSNRFYTSRWKAGGGPGRRRRARPGRRARQEAGQAGVTVFIQVDGRQEAAGQARRRARQEASQAGGEPGRRRARQEAGGQAGA